MVKTKGLCLILAVLLGVSCIIFAGCSNKEKAPAKKPLTELSAGGSETAQKDAEGNPVYVLSEIGYEGRGLDRITP